MTYYITQRNIKKIYECIDIFPKCITLLRKFNRLKEDEFLTFKQIDEKYHIKISMHQWNVFRRAFALDRWGNGLGFIEGRRGDSYDKFSELDWYVIDKDKLSEFLINYDNGEYK